MRSHFIRVTDLVKNITRIIDVTLVAEFVEEPETKSALITWKDSMKPGTRIKETIQAIGRMLE